MLFRREPRQERGDVSHAQRGRMRLPMKADVSANPRHVSHLRASAVVSGANLVAHAIQQLWRSGSRRWRFHFAEPTKALRERCQVIPFAFAEMRKAVQTDCANPVALECCKICNRPFAYDRSLPMARAIEMCYGGSCEGRNEGHATRRSEGDRAGHHPRASCGLRAGAVNAEGPVRRGEAKRRALTAAEHSSTLNSTDGRITDPLNPTRTDFHRSAIAATLTTLHNPFIRR